MGRQINFYHVEKDVIALMDQLELWGAKIVIDYEKVSPKMAEEQILNQMKDWRNQWYILPGKLSERAQEAFDNHENSYDPITVEFNNCEHSIPSLCFRGRFYICQYSEDWTYEEEVVKLYEKLRKYIKKNYRYSHADAGVYCSTTFLKMYKNKEISAKPDRTCLWELEIEEEILADI